MVVAIFLPLRRKIEEVPHREQRSLIPVKNLFKKAGYSPVSVPANAQLLWSR